jgi:hypothetical protein
MISALLSEKLLFYGGGEAVAVGYQLDRYAEHKVEI